MLALHKEKECSETISRKGESSDLKDLKVDAFLWRCTICLS